MKFKILFLFLFGFGWAQAQSSFELTERDNGSVGMESQTQSDQSEENEGVKLFIPNAFSPNDDGINDVYYISNASFKTFDFTIFDRWGNQVYNNNNPDFRWDGRSKGRKVPAGVYVFVFKGVTGDDLTIRRSGNISVIY